MKILNISKYPKKGKKITISRTESKVDGEKYVTPRRIVFLEANKAHDLPTREAKNCISQGINCGVMRVDGYHTKEDALADYKRMKGSYVNNLIRFAHAYLKSKDRNKGYYRSPEGVEIYALELNDGKIEPDSIFITEKEFLSHVKYVPMPKADAESPAVMKSELDVLKAQFAELQAQIADKSKTAKKIVVESVDAPGIFEATLGIDFAKAVEDGIFVKKGNHYRYDDKTLGNGVSNSVAFLKEHPEMVTEILDVLKNKD